jgi:hypothetical protein
MNFADWFRRTDKKLKSLLSERMIATIPRIRIPGGPTVTCIPESEADQPRIYIPDAGEEVEPGERRQMNKYHEADHADT